MGAISSRQTAPDKSSENDLPAEMPLGTPEQPCLINTDRTELKQLPLMVTPRREDALYSKIAYTPLGEQADMYKYYCPLCMSFFKDILKSVCCGNYICSECCVDFLSKHQQQVETLSSLLAAAPYEDMNCPNCNTSGFNPTLVAPSDTVRDYSDSCPAPVASVSTHVLPSPMKIGDSFEDMKRKMICNRDPRSTASPSSTLVVISSNTRLHTFSPDTTLDRLISTPDTMSAVSGRRSVYEEEVRGEVVEEGKSESRPVQLSSRGGVEGESLHVGTEERKEQWEQSDEVDSTNRADDVLTTDHSSTSTPLRGIALSASSSLPRRGSKGISECNGGRQGEYVRAFATQFVSSIFGSSGIHRRSSGSKVMPLAHPLRAADDINRGNGMITYRRSVAESLST